MNAIKLPVRVEKKTGGWWWDVVDSEDVELFNTGKNEAIAHQISLALNSHDALVDALGFYARKPGDCLNAYDPSSPGNMNDWKRIIGMDGGDLARVALAKVEEMRKTQTKP